MGPVNPLFLPVRIFVFTNTIKLITTLSRKYVTIAQYDPHNRYKAQCRPGVPSGDAVWEARTSSSVNIITPRGPKAAVSIIKCDAFGVVVHVINREP